MEGDCILFSSGGCAGEIVLLADCKRDISKHLSKVGLGRNDITDEIDLILCRTGKFCHYLISLSCILVTASKNAVCSMLSTPYDNINCCKLKLDKLIWKIEAS